MTATECPTLNCAAAAPSLHPRCTPEQQALAASCVPLAHKIARLYRPWLGEEAHGVALMHLTRAAIHYDPSRRGKAGRKAAFITLAQRFVENGLRHALTIANAQRRGGTGTGTKPGVERVRMSQLSAVFANNPHCHEFGREDVGPARLEEAEEVAYVLRLMLPKERQVYRLRYLEGLSLREIGRRLGVSRQRVLQIEIDGLDRVHAEMRRRERCK